jgi:hypothetical protein
LADDITEGGLQHKVLSWTDADGTTWLLDGRNRVDALELAGWEVVKDGRRLYWGISLKMCARTWRRPGIGQQLGSGR